MASEALRSYKSSATGVVVEGVGAIKIPLSSKAASEALIMILLVESKTKALASGKTESCIPANVAKGVDGLYHLNGYVDNGLISAPCPSRPKTWLTLIDVAADCPFVVSKSKLTANQPILFALLISVD